MPGKRGFDRIPRLLLIVLIGILMLDTLLVAAWSKGGMLPEEVHGRTTARQAARVIMNYYRQMAKSAGVYNTKPVNRALASMEKALAGKTMAEIMEELVVQSYTVEMAIGAEKRHHQRAAVLAIIRSDPKVQKDHRLAGTILINEQEVVEGKEFLSPTSIKRLQKETILRGMAEPILVVLSDGQVQILSPPRDVEFYQSMEVEFEQLQRQLQRIREASGVVALEGPGVIIEAADAPGGYLWEEIVHDQDIREIVNSLFFAGATGVEIGGQRLAAGGWVRCVGPVVVVNGKTVAANPILIKAVGKPEQLEESLRELQEVFALTGKRLDIKGSEHIALLPR